jgi:hypothetical protein
VRAPSSTTSERTSIDGGDAWAASAGAARPETPGSGLSGASENSAALASASGIGPPKPFARTRAVPASASSRWTRFSQAGRSAVCDGTRSAATAAIAAVPAASRAKRARSRVPRSRSAGVAAGEDDAHHGAEHRRRAQLRHRREARRERDPQRGEHEERYRRAQERPAEEAGEPRGEDRGQEERGHARCEDGGGEARERQEEPRPGPRRREANAGEERDARERREPRGGPRDERGGRGDGVTGPGFGAARELDPADERSSRERAEGDRRGREQRSAEDPAPDAAARREHEQREGRDRERDRPARAPADEREAEDIRVDGVARRDRRFARRERESADEGQRLLALVLHAARREVRQVVERRVVPPQAADEREVRGRIPPRFSAVRSVSFGIRS